MSCCYSSSRSADVRDFQWTKRACLKAMSREHLTEVKLINNYVCEHCFVTGRSWVQHMCFVIWFSYMVCITTALYREASWYSIGKVVGIMDISNVNWYPTCQDLLSKTQSSKISIRTVSIYTKCKINIDIVW